MLLAIGSTGSEQTQDCRDTLTLSYDFSSFLWCECECDMVIVSKVVAMSKVFNAWDNI